MVYRMNYLEIGRHIITLEVEGLQAVRESLDEHFTRAAECLVACTGRLVLTGVGKSGLIAKKIASTFSSIGAPSIFLHPVEALHGDLGMVRDRDVIIALSNSGETDELLCVMPELAQLGCKSIAITSRLDSSLAKAADFPVPVKVPREACILNLTPTASTTAALAVGDAFAACLVQARRFGEKDFRRRHPGGALGRRLSLRLEQVMVAENLPAVHADLPLMRALKHMDVAGFGTVFVVDDQRRLLGVLTDGDIRRKFVREALHLAAPVSEAMTAKPRHVLLGASVAEAMDIMEQHAITVLPVVDDQGVLHGLVHIHDLLGRGKIAFSAL